MYEKGFINLAAVAAVCIKKTKIEMPNRWLSARTQLTLLNLVQEVSLELANWQNYLRLDETRYIRSSKWPPQRSRDKTQTWDKPMTPHERLASTLRYLASGCNYEGLKFPTAISRQPSGQIISDTCRAIFCCLQDYMRVGIYQNNFYINLWRNVYFKIQVYLWTNMTNVIFYLIK